MTEEIEMSRAEIRLYRGPFRAEQVITQDDLNWAYRNDWALVERLIEQESAAGHHDQADRIVREAIAAATLSGSPKDMDVEELDNFAEWHGALIGECECPVCDLASELAEAHQRSR
jgi:hypothetical protein